MTATQPPHRASPLTPAELASIRRPFRGARLLPGRAYHDDAFMDFERDEWFFLVYVSILTLFTHRQEGVPGALDVLRGPLVGLFGTAAFMPDPGGRAHPAWGRATFGLAVSFTLANLAVALRSVRARAGAGRAVELESV